MSDWTGKSEPLEPPRGRGGGSPAAIAGALCESHRFARDGAGTVWRYNGRHWAPIEDETLRALAFQADGRTTSGRRSDIVDALKAISHDAAWAPGRLASHEVAAFDGVVDARSGTLRAHDPADRLETVIPWGYVPDQVGAMPAFRAALDTWFGGDLEGLAKVDALQEFFGYVVLGHALYKKALMLIGPSNTGKSELVHVLQKMVGAEAWCSLGVDKMDDPRLRGVLVGKRLNVVSELTTDAMIADGGFKTLVSAEDPVLIDIKWKKTFTYTPLTKHVIACNSLPPIVDRSRGTLGRLLVVRMGRVLEAQAQDRSLRDKLEAEMEGIFAWAMAGAKRLVENGGEFTDLGDPFDLLRDYMAETNPVIDFVESKLMCDPAGAVFLKDLLRPYRRNTGDQRASTRTLGARFRSAGFEVGKKRIAGDQDRALIGYVLRRAEWGRDDDDP